MSPQAYGTEANARPRVAVPGTAGPVLSVTRAPPGSLLRVPHLCPILIMEGGGSLSASVPSHGVACDAAGLSHVPLASEGGEKWQSLMFLLTAGHVSIVRSAL